MRNHLTNTAVGMIQLEVGKWQGVGSQDPQGSASPRHARASRRRGSWRPVPMLGTERWANPRGEEATGEKASVSPSLIGLGEV